MASSSSGELSLKRIKEVLFDFNSCIICQTSSGNLVSTENGHINIINAAEIRRDIVYERLKSLNGNQDFKYHVSNNCYKKYVLKKTLDGVKV